MFYCSVQIVYYAWKSRCADFSLSSSIVSLFLSLIPMLHCSVQFVFDEADAAKYVWKMCVLQHTFFKMHQVNCAVDTFLFIVISYYFSKRFLRIAIIKITILIWIWIQHLKKLLSGSTFFKITILIRINHNQQSTNHNLAIKF